MSGSSRHGSVRSPGSAASRPGTAAGGSSGGRPDPGRPGTGRAAGRPAPGSRPAPGKSAGEGRPGGGRALPSVDADRVAALAEPVIHAMDLDLEGIRVTAAGRRRVLRLVVDGDGGVSLDAIALASRELSAVLDDSEVMGDVPYTLEVSSPGVDRPLTERRHWRRAVGRLVTVPLAARPADADTDADAEPGVVEGRITEASADGVTLDVAGESRQFGYGDLGPGRIKIEFARLADEDDTDEDDTGEADAGEAGLSADELSADEEGLNGY